ncbi:MAG: hypothetical protein PW792_03540 [Acidobacteriaceae bacterium]|nr:hypothetical protein [Acidobacteriaceae bacterium]
MRDDTRKLLITGSCIFGTGFLASMLMLFVFGGVSRQGPHNNPGWLMLMITMGCLPTGTLSLGLGVLKFFGDRKRS